MLSRELTKAIAAVLIGLSTAAMGAQSERPMTNQDVIQLVKLGLSPDIIVRKISESQSSFDLSVEALTVLAQNRVPNDVIKAMQAKASLPQNHLTVGGNSGMSAGRPRESTLAETVPRGSREGYSLPPDKGAYLWDGTELHLLYQSTVPSMGQNFWRRMTPFVKQKIELQLVGAYAKVHFENQRPTILVSGLGDVIPGVPAFRLLYVKTGAEGSQACRHV